MYCSRSTKYDGHLRFRFLFRVWRQYVQHLSKNFPNNINPRNPKTSSGSSFQGRWGRFCRLYLLMPRIDIHYLPFSKPPPNSWDQPNPITPSASTDSVRCSSFLRRGWVGFISIPSGSKSACILIFFMRSIDQRCSKGKSVTASHELPMGTSLLDTNWIADCIRAFRCASSGGAWQQPLGAWSQALERGLLGSVTSVSADSNASLDLAPLAQPHTCHCVFLDGLLIATSLDK